MRKIIGCLLGVLLGPGITWALEPPTFSHESGVYSTPFSLELSAEPGADIFYTLDGSDPDPSNLEGSTFRVKNFYTNPPEDAFEPIRYQTHRYTQPIAVEDRSHEPDVIARISTTYDASPYYFPTAQKEEGVKNDFLSYINFLLPKLNKELNRTFNRRKGEPNGRKTYVENFSGFNWEEPKRYLPKGVAVKAMAVKGDESSEVVARSYFVAEEEAFHFPVVSVITPAKALFDYHEGTFVAGVDHDLWLLGVELPEEEYGRANWDRAGDLRVSEPAHLSIIDQHRAFAADYPVGIRIHGGLSRTYPQKSIRFYPDKATGGVDHDVFNDGRPLLRGRVNMRNAGNANNRDFLKDAAVHEISKGLAFGTQRYQPVNVFLNGEYFGVLNLRDRRDHYYLMYGYELPSKKVDLIKEGDVAQRGDDEAWQQFLAYVRQVEPSQPSFYAVLEEHMDMASFMDYFAVNIFISNRDWLHNNIAVWRYKEEPKAHAPATDGRWRWLMYDTDHSMYMSRQGGVKFNNLAFVTAQTDNEAANPQWVAEIPYKIFANPQGREAFIQRFSDLMNTVLLPQRVEAIVEAMAEELAKDMPKQIHRWSTAPTMGYWRRMVDEIIKFAHKRPAHQREHLAEYFDLAGTYEVEVALSHEEGAHVVLNTLQLSNTAPRLHTEEVALMDEPREIAPYMALPWQGKYFVGEPLRVKAKVQPGYTFKHWRVNGEIHQEATLQLTPEEDVHLELVVEKATQ